MKFFKYILIFAIFSCTSKDSYFIKPINDFEISNYLGTWHEIARTDNRFEKGCIKVTANYKLRNDGGIDVLNKCIKKKWKGKKCLRKGLF